MGELEPEDQANEREQKRRAQEQADDLRWFLSGPRGRRIAWRWLETAGVFRTSFNTDALAMAFAEGQRNAGLRLMDQVLAVRPDAYTQMVKENGQTDGHTDE